jgi:O-antigen/teichoic acid export membrane protein
VTWYRAKVINFNPFEKLVKFAIEALEFTGRSAIYTRLVVWLRMLTAFVSLEVAAQACAVVASFLVVRNLDKSHYAWYSLAFSLQSTLGNFTLLGIGTGMTSMAGQWIADREKMGALTASAFRYRSLLLAIAGPLVLPVFGYLLLKNGCPPWHTLALVVLAVCLLFVELNRQIFSSPVRIAGRYNYLQQAALLEAISRVAILGLLILLGCLSAWTTLLVSVLVSGSVVRLLIRRCAQEFIAPHSTPDREIQRRLTKLNFNVLPSTITFVFQAQIGIAMISIFGKTASVADLGALTRIALLLIVPQAIVSKIIEPKLARAKEGADLWGKFGVSVLCVAAMAAGCFVLMFLFRHQFLWLLGKDYSYLEKEVVFYSGVACTGTVTAMSMMLLYARGWADYMWISPVAEVLCQLGAIPLLNLSTPMGVLKLDAVRTVVAAIVYGSLVCGRFLQSKRTRNLKPLESDDIEQKSDAETLAG